MSSPGAQGTLSRSPAHAFRAVLASQRFSPTTTVSFISDYFLLTPTHTADYFFIRSLLDFLPRVLPLSGNVKKRQAYVKDLFNALVSMKSCDPNRCEVMMQTVSKASHENWAEVRSLIRSDQTRNHDASGCPGHGMCDRRM